ncbi:CheR family methyltransferase [Dethiosulfatarculus sandiegensis]|uniref:protein-glutamate O-methyltransferase n=1 Tax=Dethiosulfatarculus sandiegensis TaxID=1429043 RepID=A0A0D2JCV4_9BACT|nr:protein-glutamate O-methyltransferase [Dethiosulfatarculus sandiegensis]KIX13586.1 SAM-dependent methlyltransferase [Dethiosulfatarculus sandiegensis]
MATLEKAKKRAPGNKALFTTFTLSDKEFEIIRVLVKEKTGISLGLHKRDLVVSRLSRRLRALGLSSFKDYINHLKNKDDGDELVQMINRITTNKTDFFREKHHFEYLTNILLPQLYQEGEKTGKRELRVWSAGCSSGEEPYTLAMTMSDFFKDHPNWRFKILATDLDTTILTKASQGEYDEALLNPVPKAFKARYFARRRTPDGIIYKAKPELRNLIMFRKFNLMSPSYSLKVTLDFIFCRNVMIYFDTADKTSMMEKFHKLLRPGGHVFVGHSESLMMVKHLFKYVATTTYVKV